MKVAKIEYVDVMPGMNRFSKDPLETPIGETPYAQGETPCNEVREYGVYPQINFMRFAMTEELLKDDMGSVPYTLIEQAEYFGAEVNMYVQPELLDLLHAFKRDHVEHLKNQWAMEINNVAVAQGQVRRLKETASTLKAFCVGLAGVAMALLVVTTYVVTRI